MEALQIASTSNLPLGRILMAQKIIDKSQVVYALSMQTCDVEYVAHESFDKPEVRTPTFIKAILRSLLKSGFNRSKSAPAVNKLQKNLLLFH